MLRRRWLVLAALAAAPLSSQAQSVQISGCGPFSCTVWDLVEHPAGGPYLTRVVTFTATVTFTDATAGFTTGAGVGGVMGRLPPRFLEAMIAPEIVAYDAPVVAPGATVTYTGAAAVFDAEVLGAAIRANYGPNGQEWYRLSVTGDGAFTVAAFAAPAGEDAPVLVNPEPTTVALVGLGLALVGVRLRRLHA